MVVVSFAAATIPLEVVNTTRPELKMNLALLVVRRDYRRTSLYEQWYSNASRLSAVDVNANKKLGSKFSWGLHSRPIPSR